MSSATEHQLRQLVALRWHMVRSARARFGFGLLAAAVPVLCLAAVGVGLTAPRDRDLDILLLAPTAYLAVALLAVLAPLVAGGGNELFPPDQLTAYPVTARTHFAMSLAMTPLNLAWTTQLVGLVGLSAYLVEPGPRMALSVITCLAYVAMVTVAGQAVAWLVVGVRQRSGGRHYTWALAVGVVALALGVVATGKLPAVLDASPTTYVVIGVINAGAGAWDWWLSVTGALLALAVVGYLSGGRACVWALHQPGDSAVRIDAQTVRRRGQLGSDLREQLAVDRASIWRSAPLRRGLLVLGVLPGLVAATAGLDWISLVLLPGLVAAGAGLLFGVNAFCLDGSGAVWLASLPSRPAVAFWAKTLVVTEVCLVAVLITVAAGAMRADRLPSAAETAAMLSCASAAVARVVATCMTLSVTRPYRADLRGSRDTPAPPGVMAAYSARLAVSTTLIAILFSGMAQFGEWRLALLLALPFLLLSLRRLLMAAAQWRDVTVRARVVTTVASG